MSAPIVYVVKNQSGQFLNKHLEWVGANDNHTLYRTAHRDEAINTVFEVSSKDIYLRAEAVACPVDVKGQPAPQEAEPLKQSWAPAAECDPATPTDLADDADISAPAGPAAISDGELPIAAPTESSP